MNFHELNPLLEAFEVTNILDHVIFLWWLISDGTQKYSPGRNCKWFINQGFPFENFGGGKRFPPLGQVGGGDIRRFFVGGNTILPI